LSFEKDQERLHQSSEIAGGTIEELDVMPEPLLTWEKLHEGSLPLNRPGSARLSRFLLFLLGGWCG